MKIDNGTLFCTNDLVEALKLESLVLSLIEFKNQNDKISKLGYVYT